MMASHWSMALLFRLLAAAVAVDILVVAAAVAASFGVGVAVLLLLVYDVGARVVAIDPATRVPQLCDATPDWLVADSNA